MLKFEKTSNISIAADATESLFDKTGFRALFREMNFIFDGDDTTGKLDLSKLIITIDDTVILDETLDNIRAYYTSGAASPSQNGIVVTAGHNSSGKKVEFRFANLNCPIFKSLKVEVYNGDTTTAATCVSTIIYEEPVVRQPVYIEAPFSS